MIFVARLGGVQNQNFSEMRFTELLDQFGHHLMCFVASTKLAQSCDQRSRRGVNLQV